MAGLVLIAVHALMLALSPRFAYGGLPVLERPTFIIVALMMLAGGVYLACIWWLKLPARPPRGWWLWMIGIGLVMRALMLPSTPILETDYFRYLWDGAVLAHGHDPFAHAPQAVRQGDAPPALVELGEASGVVLERVNHPELTTIYPSTAQAAFAVAHFIMPWRIGGLRITFLLLDAATFLLLLGLLRQLALPMSLSMIYWWNPLLIKEGFNTAHMEMTLLPWLVAALWLAVRWRVFSSMMALAVATGAKLWPVLLLPALLRRHGIGWRRGVVAGLVFATLAALLVAPMLAARRDMDAGVVAYAATWQVNASLYQLIDALLSWLHPTAPRVTVAALLLAWIAWLCRTPAADGRAVCERALWITAGLFLLSPAQYPWYWLWLLPMLVVRPSPGLLVLTATLPMYYLRFPLRELGLSDWFNHGVVWLQFGPALALLAVEAWRRIRDSPLPGCKAGVTVTTH